MEKTVLLSLTTLCFLAFTLTSHTRPEQPVTDDQTITVTESTSDSIPSQGLYRIHKKTEEQEITVEVEDGNVKELIVDGKEVDPSEIHQYDDSINELFGYSQAPKSANGFYFEMPKMPPMPEGLYDYDFDLEIPPIPDMSELNIEYFFDDLHVMPEGGMGGDIQVFTRRMDDGNGTIMIYVDGDTVVQEIKLGDLDKMQNDLEREYRIIQRDNVEQWRAQGEHQREAMERELEALERHQDAMRFEIRRNEELQRDGDVLRYEIRRSENGPHHEDIVLENIYGPSNNILAFGSNRVSLSEQMVRDGLVKPGEDIEVQLTPGKLKINGEKMPDNIHQKYLKLYEAQQGIELSGKSKVEFTTKSKQRL